MSILDALGGGEGESQDYLKKALAQFQDLQTPTIASETVSNLPQETVQGAITPTPINAAKEGDTAFNNISLDPATRQAQMTALGGFQDIAGSGGLDANALLGLKQAEDRANATNAGMQGAILANAKATGNGGSDNTITQRLLAAQGAANTNSEAGTAAAAEAENNREQALSAMANIGGNINASDFGQAGAKAASANDIAARNAAAENAARTGNADRNLTGQEVNLATKQGVNASNVEAGRGNAYYNAQLPQQQFNNNLAKAQGAAGINESQAGLAQRNADSQAAMSGKLISAVGTIAGGAMGGPGGSGLSALTSAFKPTPSDGKIAPASKGGVVPGEAVVKGDSEANDRVPILASPDELVIPRSVPKDGKHMEEFARHAPVAGDPSKRVNLVDFMKRKKAA